MSCFLKWDYIYSTFLDCGWFHCLGFQGFKKSTGQNFKLFGSIMSFLKCVLALSMVFTTWLSPWLILSCYIYINSPWPCARLLRDIKFSDSLFDAVTASLNVESYHATANKMHVATQNQQKLLKHHHWSDCKNSWAVWGHCFEAIIVEARKWSSLRVKVCVVYAVAAPFFILI